MAYFDQLLGVVPNTDARFPEISPVNTFYQQQ